LVIESARHPIAVTTPSDTEVRIEREFDAPRELVYEAYTDPELLTEWLGPRRLTMTVQEMDVRTGGSYRYTHSDAEGSYVFFGEFREVDPPRLLVQTFPAIGRPSRVRGARGRPHPDRRHRHLRLEGVARRNAGGRHGEGCPRGLREARRAAGAAPGLSSVKSLPAAGSFGEDGLESSSAALLRLPN
jgi:uncharacterized protein YndB with AHSA1/START domain